MFKWSMKSSEETLFDSFKPYKGNVQIDPKLDETWETLGFKPYKGNVQISDIVPDGMSLDDLVSNPIRAMFKSKISIFSIFNT